MDLLTFAHKNEALRFIDSMGFQQISPFKYLYSNQKDYLLLTGEGSQETIFRMSHALGLMTDRVDRVINMGIVGLLDPNSKLSVGDIVEIRTSYKENSPLCFDTKSFTSPLLTEKYVDCISAENRVKSSSYKSQLSPVAQVVDRELWANHFVAKKFNLPLFSFKLVSDFADESLLCLDIRKEALLYSGQLLEHYQSLLTKTPEIVQESWSQALTELCQNIYTTESLKQKLTKALKALNLIKPIGCLDDLIEQIPDIKNIFDSALSPKQKAQGVLELMQLKLSPEKWKIKNALDSTLPALSKNIQISHCNHLEEPRLNLRAELNSEEDLQTLSASLKKIDFKSIEKIYSGDYS